MHASWSQIIKNLPHDIYCSQQTICKQLLIKPFANVRSVLPQRVEALVQEKAKQFTEILRWNCVILVKLNLRLVKIR